MLSVSEHLASLWGKGKRTRDDNTFTPCVCIPTEGERDEGVKGRFPYTGYKDDDDDKELAAGDDREANSATAEHSVTTFTNTILIYPCPAALSL